MKNTAEFIKTLLNNHLLSGEQLASIKASSFPTPQALAKELVRREWLSTYQINEIFGGRAGGLLLGSYVLIEKLGEGGMGAVFKARNWRIDRIVALKLIRKERLANDEAVKRFHREIRAAAQLEHPHIVHTLDADEVNGAHFMVMEYAPGIDLSELVRQQGPLPVEQATDFIRQAALGLQHAYERGMVHRDIKPHNLIVTRGEGDGRGARESASRRREPAENEQRKNEIVKILDMGLARIDEANDDSTTLTREGAVMGTPDYISPEQAMDSHTVDIRADIYSLGCTLYFLLTGQPPFPGGSLMEKLLKHQNEQPVAIEVLRPEIDERVTNIVYRMMAKRGEDRFHAPWEIAEALAHWRTAPKPVTTRRAAPAASAAQVANPFVDIDSDIDAPTEMHVEIPQTDEKRAWLPWVSGIAAFACAVALVVVMLNLGTPDGKNDTRSEVKKKKKHNSIKKQQGQAFDEWLAETKKLDPKAQLDAVARKLQELNPGYDGEFKSNLIHNGKVTFVSLAGQSIRDISPLAAFHLKRFRYEDTNIRDLSVLKDMPLEELEILSSPKVNLTSLKETPLKRLYLLGMQIDDFAPLRDTPIETLHSIQSKIDLPSLAQVGLTRIVLENQPDLDLRYLARLPNLRNLKIERSGLHDLSVLKYLDLETLDVRDAPITDFTPLQEMPLKSLHATTQFERDASVLRTIPSLKTINAVSVLKYWSDAEAKHQEFDAWKNKTAALPPQKKFLAVIRKLIKRNQNPALDPEVVDAKPTINKDKIVGLTLPAGKLRDVAPLAALTELQNLHLSVDNEIRAACYDLHPLRHLRLKQFTVANTSVSDLRPLADMPLEFVDIWNTEVTNLSPLNKATLKTLRYRNWRKLNSFDAVRGFKLRKLIMPVPRGGDLTPLRGMPLEYLDIAGWFRDLSPLSEAPLQYLKLSHNELLTDLGPLGEIKTLRRLHFHHTPSAHELGPLRKIPLQELYLNHPPNDIEPLRRMPLKRLELTDINLWRDYDVLKSVNTLEIINSQSPEKFWKKLDAEKAAFDKWADGVAKLSPKEQVDAVVAKLKELHDGVDFDVSFKTTDNAVTHLHCYAPSLCDLTPIRALRKLKSLDLGANIAATDITDLWPLSGMKLSKLAMRGQVRNLAPLRGMPFTYLRLGGNRITDVSPLRGMKLKHFSSRNSRTFHDLSVFRGAPMDWLSVSGSENVTDISHLQGMSIRLLGLDGTGIRDLTPMKGAKIVVLNFKNTSPYDMSPLRDVPLQMYRGTFIYHRDHDVLRSIKTLRSINDKPAEKFWAEVDAKWTPFENWLQATSKLSAKKRVEAIVAKLKEKNPDLDVTVNVKYKIVQDKVTEFSCWSPEMSDLSPLRALPELKRLTCGNSDANTKLANLWPLKDLRLTSLNCRRSEVADLAPLREMPLQSLIISATKVRDLTPLRNTPLQVLDWTSPRCRLSQLSGMKLKVFFGASAKELDALKGMPLREIKIAGPVDDLSPLRSMPLTNLRLPSRMTTNLDPLAGMKLELVDIGDYPIESLRVFENMPLQSYTGPYIPSRDAVVLRNIKTLKMINGKKAADVLN